MALCRETIIITCSHWSRLQEVRVESCSLALFFILILIAITTTFPIEKQNDYKTKEKRSQSSKQWTQRHEKDPYVKLARIQGNPSRAIYKLSDLNSMAANFITRKRGKSEGKGIIQPGSTVLDLGAAPGGWSKFTAEQIKQGGILIAVDLLPLDEGTVTAIERNLHSPTFHVIQGDFTSRKVKEEIVKLVSINTLNDEQEICGVSLIISDMAPNFTGDKMTDALQTINLCEDALMLAAGSNCFDERYIPGTNRHEDGLLKRGGSFLCKYFACGPDNEKDLMTAIKRHFELSTVFKPKASRKESAELYLFATGFKGGK